MSQSETVQEAPEIKEPPKKTSKWATVPKIPPQPTNPVQSPQGEAAAGRRQASPTARIIVTERHDWIHVAQRMVIDAFLVPDRLVAKDIMGIIQQIILKLRAAQSTIPPGVTPNMHERLPFKFMGIEYEAIVRWMQQNPREGEPTAQEAQEEPPVS